jgi:AcrR family transcriptional regulator
MVSQRLRRQTPRRYKMVQRAAGVDKTRDQIIRAAVAIQAKQGIAETSWASIGAVAHVSTATVYRHFPSLDSLIPACAQATFAAGARLPTATEIGKLFAGLSSTRERLQTLVVESCRCYERGEGWLDACRREARNLPALAAAVRTQDRALEVLIAAAVGPRLTGARAAVVKTLIDFPFWKSLVEAGTPRRQVPSIITDLAFSLVEQTVR